jgi:hypothetical protein
VAGGQKVEEKTFEAKTYLEAQKLAEDFCKKYYTNQV